MRPVDFDINSVIESLQGSCQSLDNALPEGMEYEDLSSEDFDSIDNEIFKCTTCDWWCEIADQFEDENGEMVCSDCSDSDDD